MTERVLEVVQAGLVPYGEALEWQRSLAQARIERRLAHDLLLLLEHPPVVTLGRTTKADHLLAAEGVEVFEVERGGDITFHGPGQLVSYPIIDLRAAALGVVDYVRSLEEVVIRTLGDYGIGGRRERGLTGVWAGGEKLAAIGVRVSRPERRAGGRWVTSHGLALNVSVDLEWFRRIVPCGIADRGVTSMERLLGRTVPVEEVAERLADQFGAVFGRQVVRQADPVARRSS